MMVDIAKLSDFETGEKEKRQVSASPVVRQGELSFEELLSTSMKKVNTLQLEADDMVHRLATGDVEDISEVVLASSRAEVALRMFMELRNKFVDAYQQLSRMSV
ncbi:MAG: flagellar hook-basal body complex protein FliE [Synergistaceae bacterium]|nr:flagellar hook-basal body complex protein FliE [Synergistaceae bacterium]